MRLFEFLAPTTPSAKVTAPSKTKTNSSHKPKPFASGSTTPKPQQPKTTSTLTPTKAPVSANESSVESFLADNWGWCILLPLVALIVITLILCFSKSARSCVCRWCCCSRSGEYSNTRDAADGPTRGNDNNDNSRSASKSHSGSKEQLQITPPAIPPSVQPSKYHMLAAAKTQKYIGNLLANRRVYQQPPNPPPPPLPPLPPSQSPRTAPPAARQIARTAKIIGNILTENKRRRNT